MKENSKPQRTAKAEGALAALVSLTRTYHRTINALEGHIGMTAARWRILYNVHAVADCTQKQLIELIEVDPGSITRQVKRLEAEGLIRREDDPRDNRLTRLFLTARGRQLVDRRLRQIDDFLQGMLRDLPDAEVRVLKSALDRIFHNLSTDSGR